MSNQLGLYIHIPFCIKKCDYCDFLSFGGTTQSTKDLYIEALCHEIASISDEFKHRTITTVYLGGGTPSVLSVENFEKLMDSVYRYFSVHKDAEITMEMNPGTVTEEKLTHYVDKGINRVSMGLQSDDNAQLIALGRLQPFESFETIYTQIRSSGIDNVSVDIMFGLSNQTMGHWQHTLETVIALKPEHISAYSLIIEENTVYETKFDNDALNLPDEDTERAMFWYAHERLSEAGYNHYEISNYAKPRKGSKHNSSYWELAPYIGVGLGASSFYKKTRYKNISDMAAYIQANGKIAEIRTVEQVNDDPTSLEEQFFLGLRKLRGVDLQMLTAVYGKGAMKVYETIIEALLTEGLLMRDGTSIRLSRRGIDISNQVMSRFIL